MSLYELLASYKGELGAALATLLAVKLPSLYKWSATNKRNDKDYVIDFLQNQIDAVSAKLEDLTKENIALKKTISTLQYQITVAETAHLDSPFPMWLKDTDGKMVSLNKSFEKHFLLPQGFTAGDLIGFKDESVWGQDLAKEMSDKDKEALENEIWQGLGKDYQNSNPVLHGWHFIKYKRVVSNIVIGVAGIAIPEFRPTEVEETALTKLIKLAKNEKDTKKKTKE